MFTIISVVNEQGDIVSSSQETGAVNYSDRAFSRRCVPAIAMTCL